MHSVALGRKESLKNKKNDRWEENCSIEKKKDNRRNCCCHPEI